MRLAPKSLQELTNKFIEEFCNLAHQEQIKEKAESKHPQLISDKRNDSYAFNYTLAECIAFSKKGIESVNQDGLPLLEMGFSQNIVKMFFQNSIQGFHKQLLFILKNHAYQEPYDDYKVTDVKEKEWEDTKSEINIDSIFDKTAPKSIMVTKKYKDVSFKLHNSKSGYDGYVIVHFIDNELEDLQVYSQDKRTEHLEIDFRREFKMISKNKHQTLIREEPKIGHFKHVADINSFFLVMNNVHYGIKSEMKSKKIK